MDLAWVNKMHPLAPALLRVALNPDESMRLRVGAAQNVIDLGDSDHRAQLLPLACGSAGDDVDDELKGIGLAAVWPDRMSATDLFAALTPPQRPARHGSYRKFLATKVVAGLKPQDLPIALKWSLGRSRPHPSVDDPYAELADSILVTAWRATSNFEQILPAFAEVVCSRLLSHQLVCQIGPDGKRKALWEASDPRRFQLISAVVALASSESLLPSQIGHMAWQLSTGADVPWLVEQVRHSKSDACTNLLVQFIWTALSWRWDQVETLLDAMDVPAMKMAFGTLTSSMRLNSREARKLRSEWRKAKQEHLRSTRQFELPLLRPPPAVRIEAALKSSEANRAGAWANLCKVLHFQERQPKGEYWESHTRDLRTTVGWKAAADGVRVRIVDAARRHLDTPVAEVVDDQWFDSDNEPWSVVLLYRAYLLMENENRGWLDKAPAELWQQWAPAILRESRSGSDDDHTKGYKRIKRLYELCPDVLISLVNRDLSRPTDHLRVPLHQLSHCWDDRLAQALSGRLNDQSLPQAAFVSLLEVLLEQNHTGAEEVALAILSGPIPDEPEALKRFQAVAGLVVTWGSTGGWVAVWRAIQANQVWGLDFVKSMANLPLLRRGGPFPPMPEQQVAEFYSWIRDRFPPEADPERPSGEAYTPTSQDQVARLRDGLLQSLRNRGTPAAVDAIKLLANNSPTDRVLHRALRGARQAELEQSWQPPTPRELLTLFRDPERRIVQTGDQLLEVIVESLRRWEAIIHGDGTPPAAFRLWDELAVEPQPRTKGRGARKSSPPRSDRFRPKGEERLSDEIVIHLRGDLIGRGLVVNREVEVRPTIRSIGAGKRVDILVQASVPGRARNVKDLLTVTIEVKGCWHRKIRTALVDQLRDRYLVKNGCSHGLYVVGWYKGPAWDRKDQRHKQAMSGSFTDAATYFARQAVAASVGNTTLRSVVVDVGFR